MATMEDEKLISLIKSFSCLYNKTHADFKDSIKRERIWTTIAMHMGATVDACQSRWRMLRERYAREKRMERLSTSDENASRPKWIYSDHLAFLEPHIHPRNVLHCTRRITRHSDCGYELEEMFIRLVEKHPHLYDKSRSDYKDDEKRSSSWLAIAKLVDRSVDFCEKFWASLTIKYRRERKRRKYLMEGRTRTPQMRKYDWPLFEVMSFMDEHISQRTSSTMLYEESQQLSDVSDDFLCPMLPLEVFISTQSDVASLASCSNSPSTSTELQSREEYLDFEDRKERLEDLSDSRLEGRVAEGSSFADVASDNSLDEHSSDGRLFAEGEMQRSRDDGEVQAAVVTSARDEEPDAATDEDVQFVSSLLCMFRRMKRRKKALCKAAIFRVMAEYESDEERDRKWYVQCTPESSDEKQILYKMESDELEEAIEVVPVLMGEEDEEDEEEVSAASHSDRDTPKPAPPPSKRPRPEVISVERRREPAPAPKRQADSSATSTLLRILEQLSAPQEEDRDELFGKMIASELRGVSDLRRKNRMKFQIQAVLFGEPEEK